MKALSSLILLFIAVTTQAAPVSNTTKAEIDHLFTHLENSNCQFNRNGSWYSAKEASDHLRKKYDYLVKKDMLTNAESFIEKAASSSSMSGKDYEVKCADKPAVKSAVWFGDELKQYRQAQAVK